MNQRFARLWLSATSAGIGVWALPFILGLGVTHRAWSVETLGWVLALRTAGFILAMPIGGVLADQTSRSKVTFASALLAALGTVALSALLPRTVIGACAAGMAIGFGQGASRPSVLALVQEVVEPAARQRANALLTISIRLAVLIGPGVAALASRYVGDLALLHATTALWLIAAFAPIGLSAHAPGAKVQYRQVVGDFLLGLAEAHRHQWFVAGLSSLIVVTTFGYSATMVILPLISRERFGSDVALTFGLMAYTVGGILGAITVSRCKSRNIGWYALAGNGVYAFAPLALAVGDELWLIIAAYLICGIGIEWFNVPWFTAIQREVPPAMVARVSSVDFLFSYGLAPLGLAIIAPAVSLFGAITVLVVSAVMCAAASGLAMLPAASRDFRTRRTPQRENNC